MRTITHYLLRWVIQDSAGGIVRLSPSLAGLMCQIPCGLVSFGDHDYAFDLGLRMGSAIGPDKCDGAAGGLVAALTSRLVEGSCLRDAVSQEVEARREHLGDTLTSRIKCLYERTAMKRLPAEIVLSYGNDRCEDALMKGLSSALLNEESFQEGVAAAAAFDGDSTVAAALTGALLGASLGDRAIPAEMLANIPNRDEAIRVTESLWKTFGNS